MPTDENRSATELTEKRHTPLEQLPALSGPRLPYHPAIEERFGVDKASWKALVEAIFPTATSTESVILALSYCRARRLDPFKRCVHLVPIWNRELKRYVDTVWPGIGELRTTAFRSGQYAGLGEVVYGDDVHGAVGTADMVYPEWAQVTVRRFVNSCIVDFAGPRVYWIETYATKSHSDDTPNDMWRDRPRGQITKCAEAAALRAAFPEELGNDLIGEEARHDRRDIPIAPAATPPRSLDELASRMEELKRNTVEAAPVSDRVDDPPKTEAPPTSPWRATPLADGVLASFEVAHTVGECDHAKNAALANASTEAQFDAIMIAHIGRRAEIEDAAR